MYESPTSIDPLRNDCITAGCTLHLLLLLLLVMLAGLLLRAAGHLHEEPHRL